GDRLQDSDVRLWPRHRPPGQYSQVKLARPGCGYYALGNRSGAVSDVDPLAGGKPTDRTRVFAFPAAQRHVLADQVRRSGDEDRRPQDRPALRSAAVERITQAAEETLLAGRELTGRSLLAAQLCKLPEELFLLGFEFGRRLDGDMDDQVATAVAVQPLGA